MDLLEETRVKDVFKDIEFIIEKITVLPVGQPLVWVWVWDIARQMYTDIQEGGEPDYGVTMELEEVWQLFWEDADTNGFSLEYGTEDLYEAIRDWMVKRVIIEEVPEDDE